MPNTLTEKAIAQPFRVGMTLGALTLPSLWVISQTVLHLATGNVLLDAEQITRYFALGAIPGMILGAGTLRAWVAWRKGNFSKARYLLMGHGSLVTLLAGGFFLLQLRLLLFNTASFGQPQFLSQSKPMWFFYVILFADAVPLQVALFMLLFGLFMRGSRA